MKTFYRLLAFFLLFQICLLSGNANLTKTNSTNTTNNWCDGYRCYHDDDDWWTAYRIIGIVFGGIALICLIIAVFCIISKCKEETVSTKAVVNYTTEPALTPYNYTQPQMIPAYVPQPYRPGQYIVDPNAPANAPVYQGQVYRK